jgi:hypothetical protein
MPRRRLVDALLRVLQLSHQSRGDTATPAPKPTQYPKCSPGRGRQIAGEQIGDLVVPRHSLNRTGSRIQPERMGRALALQDAPMASQMTEQRAPLHAA